MVHTCVGKTAGGARCRNTVPELGGRCPSHAGTADVAGRPDTLLFRLNMNEKRAQAFTALGVPEKNPDIQAKEQQHIAHAQEYNRDAFRYRQIADSGVPVFGKEGISGVSTFELLKELLNAEGYRMLDIHIRPRRDQDRNMRVLVLTLSRQGEDAKVSSTVIDELLRFLATSSWGFVHVWANPPREDGKVIHTVNISHRQQDVKPAVRLQFNQGLWAAAKAD